jgi:hypothetical protein
MQNGASKSNKNKFLLVLAVFGIPVIASYLAYYVWQPQGAATNYGELIPPVTLAPTTALAQLDGKTVELGTLRGKWLLVHANSGACDVACDKNLYAMRQVRLLQGRDQDRVERVWLVTDSIAPKSELLNQKFQGMLVLRDPAGALLGKLPVKGTVRDHVYVVDPLGNVMMRYDSDPDLKRMGKDLGKLLRASQIG